MGKSGGRIRPILNHAACGIFTGLMLFCAQTPAKAQELYDPPQDNTYPQFSLSGEISQWFEDYRVNGDNSQTPYSFTGSENYTEFDVLGSARFSAFNRLEASIFGVYNFSDYRNPQYRDLIIESANLTWEKGDGLVPFRWEAGDFFGTFSLRTLQRALKGSQLELQPRIPNPQQNVSLIAFSGNTENIYRGFDWDKEIFSGGSALFTSRNYDMSLNFVHNYRENDSQTNLEETHQYVSSFAFEARQRIGSHKLILEGEAARFDGDYGEGTTVTRNAKDYGYYASLKGRTSDIPLRYHFIYEHYGEDYQPRGGSVTANRETAEGRLTYRLDNGLLAKFRQQMFIDGVQSGNPTTTHTTGLDFIGPFDLPFWAPGAVTGSWSNFFSDVDTRDSSSHTNTWSSNANFSAQLGERLVATWGGGYVLTRNMLTEDNSQTANAYLGLDWSTDYDGWLARFAPRLQGSRAWSGTSENYNFGPAISLDLVKNNHSFSADYAYLFNLGRIPTPQDTENHNVSARYSYTTGPHTFGVEGDYYGRNALPGSATSSYRGAAFYRFSFAVPKSAASRSDVFSDDAGTDIRLADLPPGLLLKEAEKRLADAGINSGSRRGNVIIYDILWLPSIDTRQRLVIEHDGNRITKSVVLIGMEGTGDGRTAEQFFAQVRDQFIRRYGAPQTFEEGTFTNNFAADVNSDRLIRINEWSLDKGTLRLGLPRRLDRTVQIEVHYGKTFPGFSQTRWGLDRVR